jgi:large subunit ribosomal protein L31
MKEGLHPGYKVTTYDCSCGSSFESMSTKGGNLHIELCDKCHPFYTGQQKLIDTGGRVQRFADKFGAAAAATLEKDTAQQEARRKAAEEAETARKAAREQKAAAKAARASEFGSKPAPEAAVAEEAEVVEIVETEVPGTADAAPEAEATEVATEEA